MTFGPSFLLSFFSVYLRAAVLIFSSGLFGKSVPRRVKVGFIAVFALAISPVIKIHIPHSVAQNSLSLITFFFNDVVIGLALGFMIQGMFSIYQSAGTIIDLQIGLGNAQILDPLTRVQSSIIAQLKTMLGMILFFILGGHHHLFKAFVKSYHIKMEGEKTFFHLIEGTITFFSEIFLFALQIAVPMIAIALILDSVTGIINKAVPQMQVFFVTIPLKLMAGLFMLILLLPYMASTVQSSIEKTFRRIYLTWERIDGSRR